MFFFIKLSILGLFIYLINERISFDFEFIKALSFNYFNLFIGFFFTSLSVVVGSIRWREILKLISINLSIKESVLYTYIGTYFSVFFPGDIGGDIVKTYYVIKDKQKGILSVSSSIVIDRFIGLLTMLLLPSFIFLFYNEKINLTIFNRMVGIEYIVFITFFVSIIMFIFLINARNIIDYLKIFFKTNKFFSNLLNKASLALKDLSSDIRKYIKSISWSFLSQLLLYIGGFFIAHSIIEGINFISWMILYPVIIALSSLPITFSGIGLREYLFIIFAESLGVIEGEMLIVLSFLILLSIISQSFIGAIIYFFFGGSKKEMPYKKQIN